MNSIEEGKIEAIARRKQRELDYMLSALLSFAIVAFLVFLTIGVTGWRYYMTYVGPVAVVYVAYFIWRKRRATNDVLASQSRRRKA